MLQLIPALILLLLQSPAFHDAAAVDARWHPLDALHRELLRAHQADPTPDREESRRRHQSEARAEHVAVLPTVSGSLSAAPAQAPFGGYGRGVRSRDGPTQG